MDPRIGLENLLLRMQETNQVAVSIVFGILFWMTDDSQETAWRHGAS
jgi:hypothetical protein